MPRRSAYTLIEMVVAFSVGSVLMLLALGMLHLVLGVEETCREGQDQQRSLALLAEQFRQDAHAARVWSEEVPQTRWQFQLGPEHQVLYQREAERLVRTETAPGQPRRLEEYTVPAGVRVECQLLAEGSRMLTLHLVAEPGTHLQPAWREAQVEACLGLDHRLPVVPREAGGPR